MSLYLSSYVYVYIKLLFFSFLFKNANILQKKIILQKLHYDIFKECHSNIKDVILTESHSNKIKSVNIKSYIRIEIKLALKKSEF